MVLGIPCGRRCQLRPHSSLTPAGVAKAIGPVELHPGCEATWACAKIMSPPSSASPSVRINSTSAVPSGRPPASDVGMSTRDPASNFIATSSASSTKERRASSAKGHKFTAGELRPTGGKPMPRIAPSRHLRQSRPEAHDRLRTREQERRAPRSGSARPRPRCPVAAPRLLPRLRWAKPWAGFVAAGEWRRALWREPSARPPAPPPAGALRLLQRLRLCPRPGFRATATRNAGGRNGTTATANGLGFCVALRRGAFARAGWDSRPLC